MNKNILEYIKNIQEAINNNNIVLFVGAGVSKNSGVPTWTELINSFAEDLEIPQKQSYSADEYLKIPQYYYNKFPGKYYEKILGCLDKKTYSNCINTILFDFKPKHFITTNYDNLIEIERDKLNKHYSVINKDKDFVTAGNNNLIIKMHGDFSDINNIVLKENDYLHYSQNYKLTELFVKSIFTTNTVLFVGYSVNDSNVNQIYQWVKDILENESMPAYLIDIDDESTNCNLKNCIKEYYCKKGIHQLNYSEIKNTVENFFDNYYSQEYKDKLIDLDRINGRENPKGKALYKMLNFIKDYSGNVVDEYYKQLKYLEPLNYLKKDDLDKISCDVYSINSYLCGSIEPSKNARLKSLIEELRTKFAIINPDNTNENIQFLHNNKDLTETEQKQIEEIKNKPYKGHSIDLSDERIVVDIINRLRTTITIPDEEFDKLKYIYNVIKSTEVSISKYYDYLKKASCQNLLEFDYVSVKEQFEKTDVSRYKDNTVNIFQKAFFLYKINKFKEAYEELDKISFNSFRNKNYLIYTIAEFNKIIIGKLLDRGLFTEKLENEKNIILKTKSTSIDDIVNKFLPNDYKEIIGNKFDFSYYKDVLLDVHKTNDKIQHIKDEYIQGGASCDFGGNLSNLYNQVISLWLFINTNFLFLEQYTDISAIFTVFIDSILKSYSIDMSNNDAFGNRYKIQNFDYFDFSIMLNLDTKELIHLLEDRYDIKQFKLIEKETDGRFTKEVLINSLSNLINSIVSLNLVKKNSFYKSKFIEYFSNFFVILSKIELSKEECQAVISKSIYLIDSIDYNRKTDLFEYLTIFLRGQNNINFEIININDLCDLLKLIIKNIFNYNDFQMQHSNVSSLIHVISVIINNKNEGIEYKFEDENILDLILNNKDQLNNRKIYSILIPLNKYLSDNKRECIKNLVLDNLNNEFDDYLYYNACMKGIITSRDIEENKLIEKINNGIKWKKDNPRTRYFNDPVIEPLNMLADLINRGKLQNLDKFKRLKNNGNSFFDFIIDMQNFNYNNFDINFVSYLNDDRINELKTIIKSNNNIKKQIKDKFMEKVSIENDRYDHFQKQFFYLLFDEKYNGSE